MRKLLVLTAMIGLAVPAAAEDAKLKVGVKAPAVKATKWWQGKDAGKEVTSFAEGKVYVMEFWATWCGSGKKWAPRIFAPTSPRSEWTRRFWRR